MTDLRRSQFEVGQDIQATVKESANSYVPRNMERKQIGFAGLAVLLMLIVLTPAFGQVCGGSRRKVTLQYDEGVKQPEVVEYKLFYLMPKSDKEVGDEAQATFVSEFIYDDPNRRTGRFWRTYRRDTEFLKAPEKKAEDYINAYRHEDFKFIYESEYAKAYGDAHTAQLTGSFVKGEHYFDTQELDDTPFLMRVRADGFKTLYFISNFLGGCFRNIEHQVIKMEAVELRKKK